jgi:3-hydroxyisobutyrate dehydrogenase-like beta-hydroxyacid dehydrogenase
MHSAQTISRIAIIGFGEVGGIFGTDLAKQGIEVSVFDILLASQSHRQQMLAKARSCGVKAEDNLRDCLRNADLVISAVTASSALEVAQEAGPTLGRSQMFVDINSVSPETKRKASSCIENDRTSDTPRFIEAAVIAAVPGMRLKVPMLLGGKYAVTASDSLSALGMNTTVLSDQIGVASAVKMCRSVLVKGLEALTVECLFAARQYGAEDMVLASLDATYPGMGWKDQLSDYLVSRVAEHGRRRAAELREVAQTLKEVAIDPTMTLAAAHRQEQLVNEIIESNFPSMSSDRFSWRWLADNLVTGRRSRVAE